MSATFDITKGSAQLGPQGYQYQQQIPVPEQTLTPAGRNWPHVFLLLSVISMGLVIATSILGLMTLSGGISTAFLDIYLVVLCFFALTAELRQVKCLRRFIYMWIKYLYFLTTYTGRAFFYFFLGTLAFDGGVLGYVAGSLAIALGIIMFFVSCCVSLPDYVDPERIREEEAERQAAVNGMNQTWFSPSAPAAANGGVNTAAVNASSATVSAYRPPGINEGPNAL